MMKREKKYVTSVERGLDHVGGHQEFMRGEQEDTLRMIQAGEGSYKGCVTGLNAQARAEYLMAWFQEHDLIQCKRWAYVAAKLKRILLQINRDRMIPAPQGALEHTVPVVICDHGPLIQWYAEFDEININEIGNTSTKEFVTWQAKLALRGDWDTLAKRSEKFLADPPTTNTDALRYVPDMRFHLALAKGDVPGMEVALAEIVSPKELRWRNRDPGYSRWFIVDEAVIYAKIAWRHGYEVTVDSPWIPAEWLPVEPLDDYDEPFDFMSDFDINQPLKPYGYRMEMGEPMEFGALLEKANREMEEERLRNQDSKGDAGSGPES